MKTNKTKVKNTMEKTKTIEINGIELHRNSCTAYESYIFDRRFNCHVRGPFSDTVTLNCVKIFDLLDNAISWQVQVDSDGDLCLNIQDERHNVTVVLKKKRITSNNKEVA